MTYSKDWIQKFLLTNEKLQQAQEFKGVPKRAKRGTPLRRRTSKTWPHMRVRNTDGVGANFRSAWTKPGMPDGGRPNYRDEYLPSDKARLKAQYDNLIREARSSVGEKCIQLLLEAQDIHTRLKGVA